MTTHVGIVGHAPELAVAQGNPEAEKYGKLWAMSEYRKVAPGESLAMEFLQQARPPRGSECLDFGCGTGRGALMLALMGGLKVTMIDFVRNCLDPEIEQALTTQSHALKFVKADLEKPLPVGATYGFCTDVMEHIPTDKVDVVLNNILRAAQHVFFAIATTPDHCGGLINETLHLTVQPYEWWLEKFRSRDCIVHWAAEGAGGCCFYVTGWTDGKDVAKSGVLNIAEETARANITHNIAQGWRQVHPHPTNDTEVVVLGGGPSMPQFEAEIREKQAAGMKIVTLNGAYNWAVEHGIVPVNQVIVDARAFNARFVQPVREDCLYFIGSQCDPSVFEHLPKHRTFIFHTMASISSDLLDAQYGKEWHHVPGGSTVLLRAIPMLRMLGFRRFHLYGCDSCLLDNEHHAYAQPENDNPQVLAVTMNPGGRIFYAHPWMVSQAQEFIDLIRALGDVIELAIYGDGLLAYILNTGAALELAADNEVLA